MMSSYRSSLAFSLDIFDISVWLTHIHFNLINNGSSVKMVVLNECLLLIYCAPNSLGPVTPNYTVYYII